VSTQCRLALEAEIISFWRWLISCIHPPNKRSDRWFGFGGVTPTEIYI